MSGAMAVVPMTSPPWTHNAPFSQMNAICSATGANSLRRLPSCRPLHAVNRMPRAVSASTVSNVPSGSVPRLVKSVPSRSVAIKRIIFRPPQKMLAVS